jgi:hypothetical protein
VVGCRALKVLCAAADPAALAELKRAAVAVEWELVGGAASLAELRAQLEDWQPEVVVLQADLGEDAVRAVRELTPKARLVSIGHLDGVDDVAGSLSQTKAAILGVPRTSRPVPS